MADAEGVQIVEVDQTGILVDADAPDVLDVSFDGRRIWSFRVEPDDSGTPQGVEWPHDLRRFLAGVAAVDIRGQSGVSLFAREVRFGDSTERLAVMDRRGNLLVVDNTGRLVVSFDTRNPDELTSVVDAMVEVLDLLGSEGVAAFPAYGTLLGAVREGGFISHDSDVDLGYISRFWHPVDIIRESFRLQRVLHRRGYATSRYSGAAFKVDVTGAGGSVHGMDVFGGSWHEGRLLLMGELYDPFEEDWLLPLGTVQFEGVSLPAPANPDKMLTAMYGANWRTPDPTFRFGTSLSTRRTLDGWFRGTRALRNHWDRRYSDVVTVGPDRRPHQLAKLVHRSEPADALVVDVGCGRGQDSVWLARRDRRVLGLDFAGSGFAHLSRRARDDGWSVDFHEVNLLELRQTFAWGARLSREPAPIAVLARHFLDATTERGRRNFWRLVAMALGKGGRLYLEFLVPTRDWDTAEPVMHPITAGEVATAADACGGQVLEQSTAEYSGPALRLQNESVRPRVCRMIIGWGTT